MTTLNVDFDFSTRHSHEAQPALSYVVSLPLFQEAVEVMAEKLPQIGARAIFQSIDEFIPTIPINLLHYKPQKHPNSKELKRLPESLVFFCVIDHGYFTGEGFYTEEEWQAYIERGRQEHFQKYPNQLVDVFVETSKATSQQTRHLYQGYFSEGYCEYRHRLHALLEAMNPALKPQ